MYCTKTWLNTVRSQPIYLLLFCLVVVVFYCSEAACDSSWVGGGAKPFSCQTHFILVCVEAELGL